MPAGALILLDHNFEELSMRRSRAATRSPNPKKGENPDRPISDIAPEIPAREMQSMTAMGTTSPPVTPARPLDEEIRERAYRRYLSRGGTDGLADEDWFEAERELTRSRR